jgi:hypothetical protein
VWYLAPTWRSCSCQRLAIRTRKLGRRDSLVVRTNPVAQFRWISKQQWRPSTEHQQENDTVSSISGQNSRRRRSTSASAMSLLDLALALLSAQRQHEKDKHNRTTLVRALCLVLEDLAESESEADSDSESESLSVFESLSLLSVASSSSSSVAGLSDAESLASESVSDPFSGKEAAPAATVDIE